MNKNRKAITELQQLYLEQEENQLYMYVREYNWRYESCKVCKTKLDVDHYCRKCQLTDEYPINRFLLKKDEAVLKLGFGICLKTKKMSSEELQCLEFEKFEDYEDFDDYIRDYIGVTDAPEDVDGYVMMENLYYRLYCVSCKEESKDIRSMIDDKDLLNDISDACLIKINPLLLILEAQHYSYYDTMVDYQVSCQFKSFLEDFDHPGDELYDDDGELICGGIIRHTEETLNDEYHRNLATEALEIYNHHCKAAKLKVVRLLSCTFSFDCAYKWYMTIYAVDEETGIRGTYQAALAKRGKACTLGFFRNVDADKILAILSIQGAEKDMEAKMKLQAQNDATRKLWESQVDEKAKLMPAKEVEPNCIMFPFIREVMQFLQLV